MSDLANAILEQMDRTRKYAPNLLWIFFLLFTAHYFKEVLGDGNPWKTGDWLINGPVRRGLAGTILVAVADLGLPLRWLTFGLQVSINAMIFLILLRIWSLREREFTWLMILFSPAFLLFPYLDYQGAFRKEIIGFLAFGILCHAFAKGSLRPGTVALSGSVFTLAAFSHELAVFMLPCFAYMLLRAQQDALISRSACITYILAFSTVTFAAFVFALRFSGNPGISNTICQSIIAHGFTEEMCTGSIGWLTRDSAYGFNLVRSEFIPSVSFYLPLLALSIAPVFLTSWVTKKTLILMFVALASLTPLFLLGVDWGRWIHIFIFMIFSILLSESVRHEIQIARIPSMWTLLYLITWSLPHCYPRTVMPGLFGKLFAQLLGFSSKIHGFMMG